MKYFCKVAGVNEPLPFSEVYRMMPVSGLIKSETDGEIEVNSPEDGILKLKKTDIKERQRGLSGMPEELRQVLSKQDLRNLIEFLSGLK